MATKSLSKLKTEMVFNTDLTRLVDVMKGVAASQYHIMEHKMSKFDKYDPGLEELFKIYDFRRSRHPFIRARGTKKLIGMMTTDSGFLGGLNMKVAHEAQKLEDKESHFFVLGERGANFLKEFGKPFTGFPGVNPDDTRFDLVDKLTAFIIQAVLKGTAHQVIMVYPHATSFTTQRIQSVNLIPCPIFFKDRQPLSPGIEINKDILLESPERSVIEYLTALWLRKRLVEIFEFSKLSEYGARTMHLESSYQTLTKIDKQLKLQFFKARREKIDQSIRESFTAQLMCK